MGLHRDPIKNHLLSFVFSLVLRLGHKRTHICRLNRLNEHCAWASALLSLLDAIDELGHAMPPRGARPGGFLVLFEGVVARLERGHFYEDVLLNPCR